MKNFKLGLDFHGVIDAIPEELAWLTKAIVSSGGECHIITGNPINEEFKNQLQEMGIHYTHLFSIIDHHQNVLKTPSTSWHEKFNMPKIDDHLWDKTKGDYCKEHDITLHIDDTLVYKDHFSTPFARLWTHNNKPKQSYKEDRQLL